MKKIFTSLFLLCVLSTAVWADDIDKTLIFVDANGTEVADGSVIEVTTLEDDGWGGQMMPTGLKVKNTSSSDVTMSVAYNIQRMDNGNFQICFPSSCIYKSTTGEFETTTGSVKASKTSDLAAEWIPAEYGEMNVVLQIVYYKYNAVTKKYTKSGDGPTATVKFNYSENSGVNVLNSDAELNNANAKTYNLAGQRVNGAAYKGIVIKNGRKMLNR